MAYKLNDILFSTYSILAGRVDGEGIAIKGIFDMPKRIGETSHDWDETDSVEPYVDADEIFLAGRTILFQGIILGDRASVKTNIESLKSAIALFTDVVPLETPYGNACVYVETITPKFYKGGASIFIEFREPEVGASCGIGTGEETVYESAEYSESTEKNDCDSGYHGSTVELTAPEGMFESTLSQAAANQLAINWVRENKQAYANQEGTCIINPPVYYNVEASSQMQKDDCPFHYIGSIVTYTVEAYTYSSLISQEDADAQATADIAANFTQEYANSHGTCVYEELSTFKLISNSGNQSVGRTYIFEIGQEIKDYSIFKMSCYFVTFTRVAQPGYSPETLIDYFVGRINATTVVEWNAYDAAPIPEYPPGFPPYATKPQPNRIQVRVPYQTYLTAEVDNDV